MVDAGKGNIGRDEDQSERGGNSFRRKKLAAHLKLAREQVRWPNAQAEEEAARAGGVAAQRRAARQRVSRLEAAVREVERLAAGEEHERYRFAARASSSDPEAHVTTQRRRASSRTHTCTC